MRWSPNFMSTYRGVNARLAYVKAVVAAFNQEKALVGAFYVIVQPVVEPINRFAALVDKAVPVFRGVCCVECYVWLVLAY